MKDHVVRAGPGAGKTRDIVGRVLTCLPYLEPNRFCVVVTYTNAATEEIRTRLQRQIAINRNVFIGTTHSFLVRFLIDPFSHLWGLSEAEKIFIDSIHVRLPENYGNVPQSAFASILGDDKKASKELWEELKRAGILSQKGNMTRRFHFEKNNLGIRLSGKFTGLEDRVFNVLKGRVSKTGQRQFVERRLCASKAEQLSKLGIITYDQIIGIARDLMSHDSVASVVSRRIKYLFVDEYQDLRNYQHFIFKKIAENPTTQVYGIGDPLQTIFRFVYGQSQLRGEKAPASFSESPLLDLMKTKTFQLEVKEENHRSRPAIIGFVNRFNLNSPQVAVKQETRTPVTFLLETDKRKIVSEFFSLIDRLQIVDEAPTVRMNALLLAGEKAFYEELIPEFQLTRASNDEQSSPSQLGEMERCIVGLVGLKKSAIIQSVGDEISFRKVCFKALRAVKSREVKCDDDIEKLIRDIRQSAIRDLKLNSPSRNQEEMSVKECLKKLNAVGVTHESSRYYSTIHASKGLEGTCVLVCAATQNQLLKWLETDSEKLESNDDDYRLGYVAFSRAREFLCIACLEDLESKTREKLISMGAKCSSELGVL